MPKISWNTSWQWKSERFDSTFVGVFDVLGFAATFFDDTPPFSGFTFLFLLQLFSGFLTKQKLKSAYENIVSLSLKSFFSIPLQLGHSPWVSSSSRESWNPSWPSWLWRPPPYACALQRACGRSQPVWPSSPNFIKIIQIK